MLDSNFPVDVRRAIAHIAQGICDSGVQVPLDVPGFDRLSLPDELKMRSDLLGEAASSHMGFGTESTSESVFEADEQAAPAHGRNVRDRAQGQPRRNSRHVQSDLRISGRDGSGPATKRSAR